MPTVDRLRRKLALIDFKRLVALDPVWKVFDIDQLLPADSKLEPADWKWLTRAVDRLVFWKAAERFPPLSSQGVDQVRKRVQAMVDDKVAFQSKFDILQLLNAKNETASPTVITMAGNKVGLAALPTYGPGQPASAFIDGRPRLG